MVVERNGAGDPEPLTPLRGQAGACLAAERAAVRDRLTTGAYGVCEVCGRPIGAARLEARPTARTCVEHVSPRRGGGR